MKNTQKIYLHIRPKTEYMDKAFSQIEDLISRHPGAKTKIVGLGRDGTNAIITIELSIPRSNTHPSAVSALGFAEAVFSSLFDHVPCYCVEPTEAEVDYAEKFLARRARDNMPLLDDQLIILERMPDLENA